MVSLAELQRKLDALRTADQQFQMPGADYHHYQLNPCVTEDAVRAFEARYQITLPDDYREFLLQMGDGGAGPPFTLYPLENTVIVDDDPQFLARPFPHTQWWNDMNPPDWFERDLSHEAMDQITQAPDYCAAYRVQGTIRLTHEGCGYYNMLVVSGVERGHMWGDRRAGDAGIMPLPEMHYRGE